MIDRIEELLGSVAEENEDEEREDVLTLPTAEESIPASSPRGDKEAGDSEMGGRSGGRTAGEIASERPEPMAGELWKDAPVWTVFGGPPEIEKVLRTAAERTAQAGEALRSARGKDLAWAGSEWAAHGGITGPALDSAGRSGSGQTGLDGLYRQTVRGLRPAAPALSPEQAGRTARAQEPGSAASLAVDELDRAVRRDSRRYDGGMSIY